MEYQAVHDLQSPEKTYHRLSHKGKEQEGKIKPALLPAESYVIKD